MWLLRFSGSGHIQPAKRRRRQITSLRGVRRVRRIAGSGRNHGHKKQGRRRSIPSTTLPAPDIEIGSRHPVDRSMPGIRTGKCEPVHKAAEKSDQLRRALEGDSRRTRPERAFGRPRLQGMQVTNTSGKVTVREYGETSVRGSSGSAASEPARDFQPRDLPRLRCALRTARDLDRLRAGSAAGSDGCVLAKDCRRPSIASVRAVTCSDSFLVSPCCAASRRRTVCNWSCTTCNWSINSCWVASRPLVFSTSCSEACAVRACSWRAGDHAIRLRRAAGIDAPQRDRADADHDEEKRHRGDARSASRRHARGRWLGYSGGRVRSCELQTGLIESSRIPQPRRP